MSGNWRNRYPVGLLASGACCWLLGLATLSTNTVLQPGRAAEKEPALRGFIVSDDHFGWREPQQPKSEVIRASVAHIVERFPDLDLFVDTGDAHHGNASDQARGEWTETVLCGAGPVPFYLAAGNHDIDMFRRTEDVEWRTMKLGSISCRPYYSFDLKGIHFVVLPELIYMCYVSREALEWVKLDLELNRHRTIIFLTHNSIAGTTAHHDDPGYRRLANSGEVQNLINRHPNVLAWMHGHNHTWEIVRKDGKLFVSNGRIGGFDPPYPGFFGRGNLGGIYFEVTKEGLTVRGYSASRRQFFDRMEHYAHLTQTLSAATSFDPGAPAGFSYGVGIAGDGQRIPVYHHHALERGRRELFLTGAADAVLNENPEFEVYAERTHPMAPDKHILPGYHFVPDDDQRWQWLNPGIKIRAVAEGTTTLVAPGPTRGRTAYYRCPPGRKYRVALDLESAKGGQVLQLRCKAHDSRGECLAALQGRAWVLKAGAQRLQTDFTIPVKLDRDTIYSDPSSDNLLHVLLEAEFSKLTADVAVKRFVLIFADAEPGTTDPAVVVMGRSYGRKGRLKQGEVTQVDLPLYRAGAREVYETQANGNRKLTWLIRETGLTWQVRNAAVFARGDALDIGPLTNTFSPLRPIVIAPMARLTLPYLWRLEQVGRVTVHPFAAKERRLKFTIGEVLGPARLEVRSDLEPVGVMGAEKWDYSGGILSLHLDHPGSIEVRF